METAVVHVDVDCFYVQVELLRNPQIDKDRPAAVTQKVRMHSRTAGGAPHLSIQLYCRVGL